MNMDEKKRMTVPDHPQPEPLMGFEPTTCSLRMSCSTTELKRHLVRQIYGSFFFLPNHANFFSYLYRPEIKSIIKDSEI